MYMLQIHEIVLGEFYRRYECIQMFDKFEPLMFSKYHAWQ